MFVIPSTLSDDPSIIPASPDPAHPETPIACIGRQCRSARPPKLPASSFEVARPVPPSFNRPRNKVLQKLQFKIVQLIAKPGYKV
ncbi:hypothetical protein JHK87_055871 [Glycine soja]|nr:hypothetical protein JHK87_055871 [Glycine soja]